MWKFMIFGIVVQVVLLTSVLDVYVYQPNHVSIYHCPQTFDLTYARDVVIIVAEGLSMDELSNVIDRSPIEHHQMSVYEVTDHNVSFSPDENETFFGDTPVLYVGPSSVFDYFDVNRWHLILTDDNQTDHGKADPEGPLNASLPQLYDNFTSVNATMLPTDMFLPDSAALTHQIAKTALASCKFGSHHMKLVVFPPTSDNDELPLENPVASFIYDLIYNSSRSREYSFMISSSLDLLIPHEWPSFGQNDKVIVMNNDLRQPPANESLERGQMFGKMKELVASLTLASRKVSILREIVIQHFYVKGSVLDVIGNREITYFRDDQPSVHLYGYESFNALFQSLAWAETTYSATVITVTVVSMMTWITLLAMKTMERISSPFKRHDDSKYSSMKRMFDALCFVWMLLTWAINSYFDGPLRYALYWLFFIMLCRLVAEEILNFKIDINLTVADRIKILLQVVILFAVVEALFWSIWYKKLLFILFVVAAGARILQGAFSMTNLKTIIGLAVSTFVLGIFYLCPLPVMENGIMISITAASWIAVGLFGFRFIITRSEIDRFVMGLCMFQYFIAAILAIIYITTEALPGHYGMTYFLCFSGLFALFGGSEQKHRLLQLAMCCGAVYLFFSRSGEGLSLLAAFIACFCSFLMEKSAAKKQSEVVYYVNVFPIIFFAVTLILTCRVVAPVWDHGLFPSETIISDGMSYAALTTGVIYLLKLAYLVLPLEAAFLTSGPKVLELPNLYAVVLILNLVSFRAYIQPSIFAGCKLRDFYEYHLTLHILSAIAFYLFPIVQVTSNVFLFRMMGRRHATV